MNPSPRAWTLAFALAALAALAGGAAAEVRILAFGDSLTAGSGLPPEQGFVPQLQAWLRANGAPDATVLNAGVPGETSAGGLARIDGALAPEIDAVIVELGANDMLRQLDVGAMRKNLDGILTAMGYAVARNTPYSGGFVTQHYGRPGDGIHALQIEVNRGLYMDERAIERSAGFGRLRQDLTRLIRELGGARAALAAE